jgi:multiple sugar transport system permease protein
MKLPTWREVGTEARLLLIGIPVFVWTMVPIYHMFVFAISPKEEAFSGKLWPDHPTLHNFEIVFREQHYFLRDFYVQFWNSLVIAIAVGALTLFIATSAAFSISRLRVPGGRAVMNLALFTYFIPAAFLAVPMYRTMATYGLLNNHWSLILAMVTIASPYAIWVLKQASDKLPVELDEAAVMDGATTLQIFRLVYIPLMMPALVAIGTYAVLLAWNEYLYAFLLLSNDQDITLPVALGNFLAADDSPDEETRSLILEAARAEFSHSGYGATSMENVARRAGVSTKTLYRLLPNKAALFEAMVTDRIDRFVSVVKLRACEGSDVEAALTEALLVCAELMLDDNVISLQRVILADSDKFPEIAETIYHRAIIRTQDMLANWLRAEQRRGTIELEDADISAGMLLGMLAFQPHRAVMFGHQPSPTKEEREKRVKSCARLFLQGCRVLVRP